MSRRASQVVFSNESEYLSGQRVRLSLLHRSLLAEQILERSRSDVIDEGTPRCGCHLVLHGRGG